MGTGPVQTTEGSLSRSIAAIYEAAATPDRWPAALRQLREMFALGSTVYLVHSADRTRIDRVAAEFDPDGHAANVNGLLRSSVFFGRGEGWRTGQVIRTAEMVPNAIFHRSDMYEQYWRPRGLSEGLRLTILVDSNGVYHGVNLLRSRSGGAFEDTEVGLARALMPHLRGAVELRRRLHHVDMLAAAALTALDALRHAIVLLDQDGRVLHTNAAGDALLAKGDGLGVMRGTLQAATPSFTTRLQAALAGAAGGNGTPVRAAALRLPRPGDRRPLTVLVMPFRTEAHWSLARQPAVLLCVTDPDAGSVPSGRRLAEMFGLTGAEAALAADLLAGGELREIAERRGRSITTIRTQLARLMAKTDVNRQSELLRMLGNLPRLSEPN